MNLSFGCGEFLAGECGEFHAGERGEYVCGFGGEFGGEFEVKNMS